MQSLPCYLELKPRCCQKGVDQEPPRFGKVLSDPFQFFSRCSIMDSYTSPSISTMSRSDQIHAENMAVYAVELAEFKSSPTRTAASKIAWVTGTFGTLGVLVATPVTGSMVSGLWGCGLSGGLSALCCIACCTGNSIAKKPETPRHPDLPVDNTNYGG